MKIKRVSNDICYVISIKENKAIVNYKQSVPTGKMYLSDWCWKQSFSDNVEKLEHESELLKAIKKINIHE